MTDARVLLADAAQALADAGVPTPRVDAELLLAAAQEEADAVAADARRSQVRTVDRSERVRTYNFAENRISDHRVGFKAYNLDQVLDGALDDVIRALQHADIEALLAGSDQLP